MWLSLSIVWQFELPMGNGLLEVIDSNMGVE